MAREKLYEEDGVVVRAYVPASIAAEIGALVALSDCSKATVMRQIVLMGLVSYEMIPAETAVAAITTYSTPKETDTKETS